MTRASKRDLAARLVWLLMDKCSFLNWGMASIPRGYGKRKWKETILYWQTHYWPCRGSKNNEQRSFRKEPSRIIAAGNAGLLGHDGDWVESLTIRVGSINQIHWWIRSSWNVEITESEAKASYFCPFVRRRYLRKSFTSFMTHMDSLYIWDDSEFRYLFCHLNMSWFFASKNMVIKIIQNAIFRVL